MGDFLNNNKTLMNMSEHVSDAIPNEFSKTSNNWTGSIPYVGWVLRGLAGADNAAETYANSGNFLDSAQWGWHGFSGNAGDPNMYSEKNSAGMFGSGDPWLSVGQGVNLVPNPYAQSDWLKYGNMASKGVGLLQNQGGGQSFNFPSMGGQQSSQQSGNNKFLDMMLMNYLRQALNGQPQTQNAEQENFDYLPTSYEPRVQFGNLYSPEVSGIKGSNQYGI